MLVAPATFHEFPPFCIAPEDHCCTRVGSFAACQVPSPAMNSRQRPVAQSRKLHPAPETVCRTLCFAQPSHPLNVKLLALHQDASNPSVFLDRDQLLHPQRRSPATSAPQHRGTHRGVKPSDPFLQWDLRAAQERPHFVEYLPPLQ